MVEFAHVKGTIEAPADSVLAPLTGFGNPQLLALSIDCCTVTAEGIGAVRVIESSRGLRIHERLLEFGQASYRYRYDMLDSGGMPLDLIASYELTMVLAPIAADGTEIEWRSEGRPDKAVEPTAAFLEGLYRRATDNRSAHLAKG